MIDLPNLRDYQTDFVGQLRQAMRTHNRVIACAPTGSGKSTVAKYIIGSSYNRGTGRAVIAVHRRGLVDNIVDTFNRAPRLPHGVIMSGRTPNWSERVQVASIDTLLSWYVDGEYQSGTTFDLVAYDECHAHGTKLAKWLEAHDRKRVSLGLKPAYVIGLTATPMAAGLSQVYQEIVKGPSVQWLIDNGHLVPFRYYQARHLGRLDKLKKQGQGFTDKSLQEAFDGLAGDMVKDWKTLAEGRPTVGFFSRLSHAREAMETFNAAGVKAEYIDGETTDDKRRILFDGLQNGDYQYLCNVGIVDRGTDIPAIGCIQLCTAVNSIQRLIQILGRGARPNPGKENCCVARGTLILTDRGEVPIQDVCLSDKIWDGVQWCTHDGPCCNGIKEVIQWGGVKLTRDHKVLTNGGWKEAEEAEFGNWGPVVAGIGWEAIRTFDDSNPYGASRQKTAARGGGRLLSLRKTRLATVSQDSQTGASRLRALHEHVWRSLSGVGLATCSTSTATMPMPTESGVPKLRWARDRVSVLEYIRGSMLDCGEFRIASQSNVDTGSYKQQWALRSRKLALGHSTDAMQESGNLLANPVSANVSGCSVLRHANIQSKKEGNGRTSDCRAVVQEVWDIRNCGPLNRYCANGIIVANCVIDHGGSINRLNTFFEDDIEWTLEAEKEKDLKHEAKPVINCPQCGVQYRGGTCSKCGYSPTVKERKSQGLEFIGGELVEIKKREKSEKKLTCEQLLVNALYRAGKSGRTWKQAWGMANNEAKKQGMKFRVPAKFQVGGKVFESIPYGDPNGARRVSSLFDGVFG
jgi:superfamily II DNA or RNA helicase